MTGSQKGRKGIGGRPPKPTAQLKQSGGYRTTRHKDRVDVLVVPVRVEPPSILGQVGREVWVRFVNNLPEALITSLDTDGLTHFCQALEMYPKVWEQFSADPFDKENRITWQALSTRIDTLGRQFGWTPQSRASLQLPASEKKEESPFNELIARMA